MSGPHWRKLGLAQRHLSQKNDKLLFVACTTITIGNEHKTTFWTSSLASWATSQRLSPASVPEDETQKEIASKGSTWQQVDSRSQHPRGLHNGALAASCKSVDSRITDVAASGAGGRHIMEPNTQRQPTRPSLLAALKHQSSLLSGKCGHHQSASFFAWLFLRNRVWTLDRLVSRNWDHNPTCPLCRTMMETTHHLVSSRRYTRWVWALVADWTGHRNLHPNEWANESVIQWWTNITTARDIPRKATRSLTLLILWEIWLARNNKVFNCHESSILTILAKIKNEVSAWLVVGAKELVTLFVWV
jgi:hypothetical protein